MKRILIVNAVPTNNGDAALVLGLREKLINKGFDVTISTLRYETVRKLYPDVKWIKAEYELNKSLQKILSRIPIIKKKLFEYRIRHNKVFKDVDVIISAPGGYINSYYGIEDRLYCMKLMKELYNTKLIMYSQSVGPLNDKDKKILDKYINEFDLFMARDEVSYKNVEKYKNTIRTNDAAFLLDRIENNKMNPSKVAISVREWGFDGRNKSNYIDLIKSIVYKCIDNGYEVEFISTCQGLENYVDDSKIAKEIKLGLKEQYKSKVSVNNKYYSLNDLRNYISNFKFIVGTRLHMCILATMSGVPAFNISYEVKGKECYKNLDLREYSIDYNDEIDISLVKLQEFIDRNDELKKIFSEKAKSMNKEAESYFNYMIKNIC